MLAVRLPEEVGIRLDRLAKSTGRSKSYYVREAILRHLDGQEDLYLAGLSLQDIRSGVVETIPLEEPIKEYDRD